MKAKSGSRFIKENRTRLETVIPLKTPFLLFVDPSSACNFRCGFCPCGNAHKSLWTDQKNTSVMSYELFRKIIDDISYFPEKIKTLRLYKEGEPLLNKRLPDMIRYAKRSNSVGSIDFTTNGVLLTKDLGLALVDSGLDRINISIEALDSDGYLKISGVKIDYDAFYENLSYFYKHKENCYVFMKISDAAVNTEKEKERFFQMYGDICDEISVEHITPVWPEFDLDKDYTPKTNSIYNDVTIKECDVCPYIFYSICVNSDGSVSACLMDWNHKQIVGNIAEQSLKDIWNSDAMKALRYKHLKCGRSKIDVCNKCGQMEYGALDNIDDYREELLKKI